MNREGGEVHELNLWIHSLWYMWIQIIANQNVPKNKWKVCICIGEGLGEVIEKVCEISSQNGIMLFWQSPRNADTMGEMVSEESSGNN